MDFKIFSWNVRGLGNRDKRVTVGQCISKSLDLVCFQETKLSVMNDMIVNDVWGQRTSSWLTLPYWGALGGILLIWNENKLEILDHEIITFSVSIRCKLVDEWVFVGVYGHLILVSWIVL